MKHLLILLSFIPLAFTMQSCEPTRSPGSGAYYGSSSRGSSSANAPRRSQETMRKVRQMSGSSLRRGY